jgi:hypothetical protein
MNVKEIVVATNDEESPLLSPLSVRSGSNEDYSAFHSPLNSMIDILMLEDDGNIEDHPYYNAIDTADDTIKNLFPTTDEVKIQGNNSNSEHETKPEVITVATERSKHSPLMIAAMLSVAAAYGSIIGTFFLLTLPVECSRMSVDGSTKSVNLGIFIFVAGFTQLASPWIGLASDSINNPQSINGHKGHQHALGRRRPFLVLGYALCCLGFLGMSWCSKSEFWVFYGLFYTVVMLALNIVYSAIIALIPDLISPDQTGYVHLSACRVTEIPY